MYDFAQIARVKDIKDRHYEGVYQSGGPMDTVVLRAIQDGVAVSPRCPEDCRLFFLENDPRRDSPVPPPAGPRRANRCPGRGRPFGTRTADAGPRRRPADTRFWPLMTNMWRGTPRDVFSPLQATRVRDAFGAHGVDYMLLGRGAAILQGFPDTTQDVDAFVRRDPVNGARALAAVVDLGFAPDAREREEILAGKDFVQLRCGPFDLDLIHAPDGFDSYDDALRFRRVVDGFPVMSLEGIILSKRAAGRARDREALPRLVAYAEYLAGRPAP